MYTKQDGRQANTEPLYLRGRAQETTNGTGGTLEVGDARVARVTLSATLSGTAPTLDVTVEGSDDGVTFADVASFAQLTVTGSERKAFLCSRFMRVSWEIAGDDGGSTTPVVQSGEGPAVTITGTPAEDGSGTVTINATAGERGTAEFDWSYGGESDTDVVTAATVVLGTTGLTANFASGTYVEAETYQWDGLAAVPDTVATFSVVGETV